MGRLDQLGDAEVRPGEQQEQPKGMDEREGSFSMKLRQQADFIVKPAGMNAFIPAGST